MVMCILSKILGNQIKKSIREDKEIKKIVNETDEESEKIRKSVDELINMGLEVPDFMKEHSTSYKHKI
jgi:hypothetical protein